MGAGRFLGRVLFAAIFLLAGVNKLQDLSKTAGYVGFGLQSSGVSTAVLNHTGFNLIPFTQQLALVAAVVEILGGLLIVLGAEKVGATILLGFLAAVTPIMHNPFKTPGKMDENEFIAVLKNTALAGACLLMLDNGRKAAAKQHRE